MIRSMSVEPFLFEVLSGTMWNYRLRTIVFQHSHYLGRPQFFAGLATLFTGQRQRLPHLLDVFISAADCSSAKRQLGSLFFTARWSGVLPSASATSARSNNTVR